MRNFVAKNLDNQKFIVSASLLLIFAVASAVFAAGRCIPCKQNHYCTKGVRYECPTETPVTQIEGKNTIAECMSCADRDGAGKPIFDILVGEYGDCVSCYEYNYKTPVWTGSECKSCYAVDNTKPVWNGSGCEPCPSGEKPNSNGVCVLETAVNECEAGYITIDSADELAMIGVDSNYPLNGKYCQMADISLEKYGADYNNGEGWTPIANYAIYNHATEADKANMSDTNYRFKGTYDGNNKIITNLYINRPNKRYQGLFGTNSAVLRNINIDGANVTGYSNTGTLSGGGSNITWTNIHISNTTVTAISELMTGGLAGGASNSGNITNCSVSGIVNGKSQTGGLMGYSHQIGIKNSSANVIVSGVSGGNTVGGLIGQNAYSSIKNSYSKGTVNCTSSYCGGFVGSNFGHATLGISECYSTADVISKSGYVGGFTGNGGITIANCYSTGDVSGTSYTGGFCGTQNGVNSKIYNSYSVGTTTDSGFITFNYLSAVVSNSFFDKTIAGTTFACAPTHSSGNGTCENVVGLTTEEMQTPQTFIDAGWDESIWELIQGQYPKLIGVGGQ